MENFLDVKNDETFKELHPIHQAYTKSCSCCREFWTDNNCQEIWKEFEGIFKRNCINAYICQTNVIDSRGQEMLTAAVIVKEGGDPEVAKADQPEVRDLVQQVAREE